MKKGKYLTPEGKTETVLMVDEINKMVYINLEGSRHRWVHENEYSTWTALEENQDSWEWSTQRNLGTVEIQKHSEEIVSEKPKKKIIKK